MRETLQFVNYSVCGLTRSSKPEGWHTAYVPKMKKPTELQIVRQAFHLAGPEGFEPSMQVLPAYSLSRGAPSASRSQPR
jgi:hypothetical protein